MTCPFCCGTGKATDNLQFKLTDLQSEKGQHIFIMSNVQILHFWTSCGFMYRNFKEFGNEMLSTFRLTYDYEQIFSLTRLKKSDFNVCMTVVLCIATPKNMWNFLQSWETISLSELQLHCTAQHHKPSIVWHHKVQRANKHRQVPAEWSCKTTMTIFGNVIVTKLLQPLGI